MKQKTPRKPREKKPTKEWADRLVSAIAILRDKRCVTCGSHEGLQPGHYFRRTHQSVRWVMQNVGCQCPRCNRLHNTNPEPLRKWIVKRFGAVAFEETSAMAGRPLRQPYMPEIIALLQGELYQTPAFDGLSDSLKEKVMKGTFRNWELEAAIR